MTTRRTTWRPERTDRACRRGRRGLALLGEDFFADVVAVHVSRLLIGGPPRSVPITDAWLEHIGKLSRLEVLDLKDSCVSDAGLKQIQRLTRFGGWTSAATESRTPGWCR